MDLFLLCGLALAAGFVDAIAGGGGLIQLPGLMLILTPEKGFALVGLLGTNKLSSICGTTLAVRHYATHLDMPWRSLLPAAMVAFAGSFAGARMISQLDPRIMTPLVIVLVALVALHTFLRPNRLLVQSRLSERAGHRATLVAAGIIGAYDGFFGPGTGSFLIVFFTSVIGLDFLAASARAKVLNLATNLAAVLYFASTGNIYYEYAIPMAACNMMGAAFGARLAILKGSRFVRSIFLLMTVALLLRLVAQWW